MVPVPEPDHADLQRGEARIQSFQQATNARRLGVIGRRRAPQFGPEVLAAVHDRAVHQRAIVVCVVRVVIKDAHDTVEIALGDDRPVVEGANPPDGATERRDGRCDAENPEDEVFVADLPEQEERADSKTRGELEIGGQHERGNDSDEHRAQRAAQREHQVEACDVAWRRFQAGELAVAEHAGEEQARAEDAELQGEVMLEVLVGEREGHAAERRREHHAHESGPVPAGGIETQDEAEQVDRKRDDPEQWDGRDVLRDVVGHGEQQQRAGCRQRAPEQLSREGWCGGALAKVDHCGIPRLRRMSIRPLPLGDAGPARGRAQADEERVAQRPADRLRARRRPWLEQERIAR